MLYQWIISLPMMVCLFWAVFFVVRCVQGKEEPRVRWSILLFYIFSTVLYLDHWLYFSGVQSFVGLWTYLIANLSVYPLYYMYLLALTRTKSPKELAFLFVPAVLITLLLPLSTYCGWMEQSVLALFARICFALQVVWVWVRGFLLLRQTQQRLDATYADNRSLLLQPTHSLLLCIGFTATISILLNILGRDLFDGSLIVGIPAVLMTILLFSLGYIAAHTSLPKETVARDVEKEELQKAWQATTEETDELMYRIGTIMREQQLFTDPHLTIQDLAAAVGSNRTYVSQCINRCTGYSFSQYVARYRVEQARLTLCDPQYTTDHDALANSVALNGFASDQTFYRVFKDITGLTPLQYRHKNLQ